MIEPTFYDVCGRYSSKAVYGSRYPNAHVGLRHLAGQRLKHARISPGGGHFTSLHARVIALRGFASGILDRIEEIYQSHFAGVADID